MPKETISVPASMGFIRNHIRAKLYRLTKHATIVLLERGISLTEMEQILNKK